MLKMSVFNSAVPRLDTTSIETMVAFQFDGTALLLLNIQVNTGCSSYIHLDIHYSCTHYALTITYKCAPTACCQ